MRRPYTHGQVNCHQCYNTATVTHTCQYCGVRSECGDQPGETLQTAILHCPSCGMDTVVSNHYAMQHQTPQDHGHYEDAGRLL